MWVWQIILLKFALTAQPSEEKQAGMFATIPFSFSFIPLKTFAEGTAIRKAAASMEAGNIHPRSFKILQDWLKNDEVCQLEWVFSSFFGPAYLISLGIFWFHTSFLRHHYLHLRRGENICHSPSLPPTPLLEALFTFARRTPSPYPTSISQYSTTP